MGEGRVDPAGPGFESPGFIAFKTEAGDTIASLRQWTRSMHARFVTILDMNAIAIDFLH